jgi:hypothetical protein
MAASQDRARRAGTDPFQITIRENVKYGKRKATDEEVETANAKKFIVKMEKRLDTIVRDPTILMTDEATPRSMRRAKSEFSLRLIK